MLCENCGNHEANVKYTQIVNGVKKEMTLCEKCAEELGIEADFNFNMSVDLPSFLGEFMEEYSEGVLPSSFSSTKKLKCDHCGMTYDEFVSTGKLGCEVCYDIFADRITPILKNLHGSSTHVGRKGRLADSNMQSKVDTNQIPPQKTNHKPQNELEKLKEELKKAIKEEKYEDAAKLRDEIKSKEDKSEK